MDTAASITAGPIYNNPALVNPVLAARQALQLSQGLLAKRLGVTEQTIRRSEQGTFNQLPPSVANLDKMLSDAGFDEYASIESNYELWRLNKRVALRRIVPSIQTLTALCAYSRRTNEHPFALFRQGMMESAAINSASPNTEVDTTGLSSELATSVAGFAKLVAISPDSINEFERGTGVGILRNKHPEIKNLLGDLGLARHVSLFIRTVPNG